MQLLSLTDFHVFLNNHLILSNSDSFQIVRITNLNVGNFTKSGLYKYSLIFDYMIRLETAKLSFDRSKSSNKPMVSIGHDWLHTTSWHALVSYLPLISMSKIQGNICVDHPIFSTWSSDSLWDQITCWLFEYITGILEIIICYLVLI